MFMITTQTQAEIILLSGIVAIALVLVAVASLATSLVLLARAQNAANIDDMSPLTSEDINIMQVKEGLSVPLLYGRKRIGSNLLWYGNVLEVPTAANPLPAGSKGGSDAGGGSHGELQHKYFMDAWLGLAQGKISFHNVYIEDKERDSIGAIPLGSVGFLKKNDGTETTGFELGIYRVVANPVAWLYMRQWYLGKNTTRVPSIDFVLQRHLEDEVPLPQPDHNHGNNPAAIVYDLLVNQGGVAVEDIDITSFTAASNFWAAKNYWLSIIFKEQIDLGEAIRKVLGQVDGLLYMNREGKWKINPFDPSEIPVKSLVRNDYINFKFSRQSYSDTYNIVKANFTDASHSHHFSNRVVQAVNPASVQMIGKRVKSIDLRGIINPEVAQARVTEVMKRLSYPVATIEFTTTMQHSDLEMGNVVNIMHEQYNINSNFRIVSIDVPDLDKNEIVFKAIEHVEALVDGPNWIGGGTKDQSEPLALEPLEFYRVFEMPWTKNYQFAPAYLLLFQQKTSEAGISVLYSRKDADYRARGYFTEFSLHGTLDEEYPDDTYTIDDERGILFTPSSSSPNVTFESISRDELFHLNRVAIIDNEVMLFQTVTPEGPSSLRLKGVIRGMLHSTRATHATGATIWLANVTTENILIGIDTTDFYLKLIPFALGKAGDITSAVTVHVENAGERAKTPWKVAKIKGERTGNSLELTIWPCSKEKSGAGAEPAESYTDRAHPFLVEGDFEVTYGDKSEYFIGTQHVMTIEVGEQTLTIFHWRNGRKSEGKDITIGASDGIYYS